MNLPENIVKRSCLSYGGATRAFKLCHRNAHKLRGIGDKTTSRLFTQKLEVVGRVTCFSDILGPLVLKRKTILFSKP